MTTIESEPKEQAAQGNKGQSPTDTCRIFISRKLADGNIANFKVREDLKVWAAGRLEFFNPDEIRWGEAGRVQTIQKELARSNLFFLVLPKTQSSTDYQWPLWEAGWFRGYNDPEGKRSVCFVPKGGRIPEQLGQYVKPVEVTVKSLVSVLHELFTDREFTNTRTELNPKVTKEMVKPIAEEIYQEFVQAQGEHVEYGNPWVRLHLPLGSTEIEDDTEFQSDAKSLDRLFDMPENPPPGAQKENWTWDDLKPKTAFLGEKDPTNFNQVWMEQLKEEVRTKLKGVDTVEQLTGRFLSHQGDLFRPEIEQYRTTTQELTVLVTFSEQVQDVWLRSATAPVALAANIALASRIRHELIMPYHRKVRLWKLDNSIKAGLKEMGKLAAIVERHGFFIGQMTQQKLVDAFENYPEELGHIIDLWTEYKDDIKPKMEKATQDADIDEVVQALDLWDANNLKFLDIAIKRYQKALGLKCD